MATDFKMDGGLRQQFVYCIVLPVFFLGSTLLYNPFGVKSYYNFGGLDFDFHLVMLSCIILVSSIMTRICLKLFMMHYDLNRWKYVLWCFAEALVMSAFIALYTVLFSKSSGGYFSVLPYSIKIVCLLLVYPYSFLILMHIVRLQDAELQKKEMPSDNSLIRFYDEHRRLKFSIAPSSVLFVSSEFNYVRIHYLDGGKVKDYMLRASMKSLENINSKSLVRCQRSYFVNPEHVSVLRKDPEGFIFAEMNIPDVPAVPVSKQYYDALSALL